MNFPIKILVYTFCHNDALMLPFIIDYWKLYATKVVVYDNMSIDNSIEILSLYDWIEIRKYNTNGKFDPEKIQSIKNSCYKECANTDIDYVMVCDIDEVLAYGDNLLNIIKDYRDKNIKLINAKYYDVLNVDFPNYNENLLLSFSNNKLINNKYIKKLALFDPNVNIVFSEYQTSYEFNNTDKNTIIKTADLSMLHFKLIGLLYYTQKLEYMISNIASSANKNIAFAYGATKNFIKYIFSSKNAYWYKFRITINDVTKEIGEYKAIVLKLENKKVENISDIKWENPVVKTGNRSENKLCAIIIPIYKVLINDSELASLKQLVNVFGTKYDIYLVGPRGLSLNHYMQVSNKINSVMLNPAYFRSTATYSKLCMTLLFYLLFTNFKYMLIYLLDGWVFYDNLLKMIDYDYDYIGSPWKPNAFDNKNEMVGNGGVSLRKTSKFIQLFKNHDNIVANNKNKYVNLREKYLKVEDLYICQYLAKLTDIDIATVEDAVTFSLDSDPEYWINKYKCTPMFAHAYNKHSYWKTYKKEEKEIKVQNTNNNYINYICADEFGYMPAPCYDYNDKIIITMTSWSKRIKNVKQVLESIMANTMLPAKIVINLAVEEFINKEPDLPKDLVDYINDNNIIEINWLKHNTAVWKKIFPTLCKYPNAKVICIDDDRIYPKHFINTFYEASLKYPNNPLSGANISFYNKIMLHCGHCTLDKYEFYSKYLDFITLDIINLKSSDSFYTFYSEKCGHPIKYLGVDFHNQIKEGSFILNNDGYSKTNNLYDLNTIFNKLEEYWNEYIKSSSIKVALCAIAKNENLYIREWVEYYKNIGISHIFLYDNNEINGERFEEVINDYIENGFVEIIDKRGVEKGCVFDNDGINLQSLCYIDCYEKRCNNYDWLCLFDIDEFIYFDKNIMSLQSFLNTNKKYSHILLPWVHYDDNNLFDYDQRPVVDRFKHKSKFDFPCVKSIVRTGYQIKNKKQENLIHCFTLTTNNIAYSDLGSINLSEIHKFYIVKDGRNINANVVLNHYKTKTISEFLLRHYKRHWGTGLTTTKKERTPELCYKDFCFYNEKQDISYEILKKFNYNKELDNVKYFKKLQQLNYNDIDKSINEYINILNIENNHNLNGKTYNNEKGIIALTSWKGRINFVYKTLINIYITCPNFHIVLTLSEEEFPKKYDSLPIELQKLITNDIVEILWVEHNYKTAKKIIFALEKYKDYGIPIISADDDCYYICNYAEELYQSWKNGGGSVIRYNMYNKLEKWQYTQGPSTLYGNEVFDIILKLMNLFKLPQNAHIDDTILTNIFKKHKINITYLYRGHRFCFVFHDEILPTNNNIKNIDFANCYLKK